METHRDSFLKKHKLDKDKSYSLDDLSKISGVSRKTLQEVYDRGIGAWKSNPESVRVKGSFKKDPNMKKYPRSKRLSKERWAYARVYSFLDKGKTYHTADSDLVGGSSAMTGDTLQTREEINEAKEYALNDQDIRDLIGSTNIFTYPHLENVRHIDEVFKSHGNGVSSAIVLFLTDSKNKGHWISLLKKGDTIEIYDPYGNSLKQLPKFLGGVMADKQDPNLLLNLIKKGGYRVVQNHTQDQPESPDINTCGRHAVARIMFGKLDLPEYHKTISKLAKIARVSKDDFITALTADFLGK